MTDRLDYYEKVNRRTPVIPFRAPSPQHYQQVRLAAEGAGLTVSEWIRRAVAKALADPSTTTST